MIQILQNLDRDRFEPIICSIRPFGHLDEALHRLKVEIICLNRPNPYDPRAIIDLCKTIKARQIDIVQIGIFGSEFHALLAAWITGTPAIAVLESIYALKDRARSLNKVGPGWWIKWGTLYAVHGIIGRLSKTQYVALSNAVKESGIKDLHLPGKKISVIPLGLDPAVFSRTKNVHQISKIKQELGLIDIYPVLINVVRLSPPKGLPELFKAMALVHQFLPNAKLLIAGDGPLQGELEALKSKLGLHETIMMLGRRDDVPALLNTADFFVFSSVYEGLPGAVIEAMAAEKPVVAFDIPALDEVVKNNVTGILVKNRDIAQLANAIIDLANQPDRYQEMAQNAKDTVQEKFDILSNIRQLQALYDTMYIK